MTQHARTEQVAVWASEVHADTQERPDKKAARTHGKDRSVVSRWRTIGRGSPCFAALQYVLRLSGVEAMRVASAFLSAARMTALGSKSTDELIRMWWACVANEVDRESADRALQTSHPDGWDWREKARAAERNAAADLTLAAIERVFAARNVAPADVLAGRAS